MKVLQNNQLNVGQTIKMNIMQYVFNISMFAIHIIKESVLHSNNGSSNEFKKLFMLKNKNTYLLSNMEGI